MITFIRRVFKVTLNSLELDILSKAQRIVDEIVTNAIKEEELKGIKMGEIGDAYSINDLSTCAMILYDLCASKGHLEGY